jgi:hypothetical protein
MGAVGALVALPRGAHAGGTPDCDDLPGDKVYLQVGDTQANLMKRLGRAMRDNTPNPVTMVYFTTGSCTNIQSIYNQTPIPAGTTMFYIPSVGEDPAWVPSSPPRQCIAQAGGVVPTIANSALFNSACTTETPPPDVHHARGPVQAYVMAVPEASEETAITYEEAYFVFGFGTGGMIVPWDDETQMFIRTVTKSTLLAWAANISVPAAQWKGVAYDMSSQVVGALQASTTPDVAIGILGAEVYDGLRDSLDALAFRARGQYAAYYPDSTASARDKKNVRDGHYTVWSPTIWMDRQSGGTPINADGRYLVDLISGRSVTPAPNFSMIQIIQAVGLVPDCAMGVDRDSEGANLRSYSPTESCACKYESLTDTGTACATCDGSTPCASGVCREGYCEAQ